MRFLDRNKIPYEYQTYECDEFIDGISVADKIGLPHEQVYKTLVTVGKKRWTLCLCHSDRGRNWI